MDTAGIHGGIYIFWLIEFEFVNKAGKRDGRVTMVLDFPKRP